MSRSQDEKPPVPGYDTNGAAATLLRLASVGRPRDVLLALQWAQQAGALDWTTPATPNGDPLLTAWVVNVGNTHKDPLPIEVLDTFDTLSQGAVWTHPNAQGEHLFERWLQTHHRIEFIHDAEDQALADVLRRSDPMRVKAWHTGLLDPLDERDPSFATDTLVTYLLGRVALHALHTVFDQGMNLLGTHATTGQPLAADIRHPVLWTAFLDQGGDPAHPVITQKATLPLWQHLRQLPVSSHTSHLDATRLRKLTQTVEEWAREHAPEELDQVERAEYWAALNDHGDASTMKSRPDWPLLRDDHGRTPMMVLIRNGGKYLKEFWTIKKAAGDLAAVDQDGRSLWFYALAHHGRDLAAGALEWLVGHVPLQPDHQGWGLVQQCAMAPTANAHKADLKAQEWPDEWLGPDDQPRWWGTPQAQDHLAAWMLTRPHAPSTRVSNGLTASFVELSQAAHRASWDLTPSLLGALVINELARSESMTVPAMNQAITPWLDAGASVPVPGEILERLQTMHPAGSSKHAAMMTLLGRLEANALTQVLGLCASPSTAPVERRRL